jgi:hypothetical protein
VGEGETAVLELMKTNGRSRGCAGLGALGRGRAASVLGAGGSVPGARRGSGRLGSVRVDVASWARTAWSCTGPGADSARLGRLGRQGRRRLAECTGEERVGREKNTGWGPPVIEEKGMREGCAEAWKGWAWDFVFFSFVFLFLIWMCAFVSFFIYLFRNLFF